MQHNWYEYTIDDKFASIPCPIEPEAIASAAAESKHDWELLHEAGFDCHCVFEEYLDLCVRVYRRANDFLIVTSAETESFGYVLCRGFPAFLMFMRRYAEGLTAIPFRHAVMGFLDGMNVLLYGIADRHARKAA